MKKSILVVSFCAVFMFCGSASSSYAQCDPNGDPNCFFSLLPAAPPSPDSTKLAPLSTEDTIKFAYDTINKGQTDPSGTVMNVAIAAITVGYPPAGVVLGIFKGLIDSAASGPDPVGQALQQLNQRVDKLQLEINNVETTVQNLHSQILRDENEETQNWLQSDFDVILEDKAWLAKHPTDPAEIAKTVKQLQQTANHYVDRPKRWQWSDVHVFTDSKGVVQQAQMDPDFKSQPTFDTYSHALVLWMAALQYASKGDPHYITGDKDTVASLLKHAAFLSMENNWDKWRSPIHTLPEQVVKHASCGAGWTQRAGKPGAPSCQAQISCSDLQRHTSWKPASYPAGFTFTPKNGGIAAESWCEGQAQPLVDDAELELLNYYGYSAMQELAGKLLKLAKTGSLEEQFIGQFDMTFYTQQRVYTVKPTGELLMYRHTIAIDKNPPQSTQRPLCSWALGKTCLAASSFHPASAVTPATDRNRMVSSSLRMQASPQIVHKWDGPYVVGSGWQQFRQVIPAGTGNIVVQTPKGGVPAGGTAFYAVANDGSLLWYRQDSIPDAKAPGGYSYQWKGPMKVASGFNTYKQIFSGGDGVIYAIGTDGSLNQYRFSNFQDVTPSISPTRLGMPRTRVSTSPAPQNQGPNRIATGWGNYTQVFSTGEGIIYAVTPDGRLLWSKDMGNQGGLWRFAVPKQVGTGWSNMRRIFSPGDGVIYGISNTGEVFWYKHDGYKDGTPRWEGPTKIASDWDSFVQVFPWMPTTASPGAIH